jgi:hypothetical protein
LLSARNMVRRKPAVASSSQSVKNIWSTELLYYLMV